MTARRALVTGLVVAVGACLLTIVPSAQGPAKLPVPLQPFGDANEAIWPDFEAWGASQDGQSIYFVLGYKNRSRQQTVEIPIGPNNRIEPGGPDQGQPTTFAPNRQFTTFAIKVPKDFGTKKLTWTLVANGQPTSITFYKNPEYNMDYYKVEANGNEPPKMKLGPNEPILIGPNVGFSQTLYGTVGQPVPLKMWTSDKQPTEKNWETIVSAQNRPKPQPVPPGQIAIVNGRVIGGPGGAGGRGGNAGPTPDLTVSYSKLRGPGKVTIAPAEVPLFTKGDPNAIVEASSVATFSAPGEYLLRAEPVEVDDGFDGLCCFTFANIKVIIK
jgi:hypothetical protein